MKNTFLDGDPEERAQEILFAVGCLNVYENGRRGGDSFSSWADIKDDITGPDLRLSNNGRPFMSPYACKKL